MSTAERSGAIAAILVGGLVAGVPYRFAGLLKGLLVHMLLVGLPIAYSVHRFTKS